MHAPPSSVVKPWRIAFRWGVVLSVAVCAWTLALHAFGWYTTNMATGLRADQAAILLPGAAILLALRERARVARRTLSLREALWTGLLTGWFSIPISAAFLWLYHHHINPQWLDVLIAYHQDRLTHMGTAPDEVARTLDAQRASGGDAAQIVGAVVGTTAISLVISGILWTLSRMTNRHRSA